MLIFHYLFKAILIAIIFFYVNKISKKILNFDEKIFQSKFNILKNCFKKSFIKTPKNNIEIIEPNPWMYANLNNLTINFLREFGKQLNLKDNSKINRKLANLLDDYGHILNSLDTNSSLILKGITKILRINQHEKSA
jgi:transcriptional regulator of heat shock response